MTLRRRSRRSWFSIVLLLLFVAANGQAQEETAEEPLQIPVARTTNEVLAPFKAGFRDKALGHWKRMLVADASLASARNREGLYPNPSLQAYVNHLGQSLVPAELDASQLLSFRIVQDPLPFADALATGTVYISTGLLSLLDNESQLAFVLVQEASHMILAHHTLEAIGKTEADRKAKKIQIASAAAGVMTAGMLNLGDTFAAFGGYYGYKGGIKGAEVVGRFRDRRHQRNHQYQSDAYAADIILSHGFDPREATVLMAKVERIVRQSNASVDLAFGGGIDLPARAERLEALIDQLLTPTVERILGGEGFRVASPRFFQLMASLKRDNGRLALDQDLFAIAKANLEESANLRDEDPVTMLALGQLYSRTARSEADLSKASHYLQQAMESDGLRHRHPESYLQYAVELLAKNDPRLFEESRKALKTFVALYQRRAGGKLPPEIQFVYDCLARTGDTTWIAYEVDNINTEQPYQLTGLPEMDELPSRVTSGQ